MTSKSGKDGSPRRPQIMLIFNGARQFAPLIVNYGGGRFGMSG